MHSSGTMRALLAWFQGRSHPRRTGRRIGQRAAFGRTGRRCRPKGATSCRPGETEQPPPPMRPLQIRISSFELLAELWLEPFETKPASPRAHLAKRLGSLPARSGAGAMLALAGAGKEEARPSGQATSAAEARAHHRRAHGWRVPRGSALPGYEFKWPGSGTGTLFSHIAIASLWRVPLAQAYDKSSWIVSGG